MKLTPSQTTLLWYVATNEPAKFEDLAGWARLPVGAALASLRSLARRGLVTNAYGRWALTVKGIHEHRARMENMRG